MDVDHLYTISVEQILYMGDFKEVRKITNEECLLPLLNKVGVVLLVFTSIHTEECMGGLFRLHKFQRRPTPGFRGEDCGWNEFETLRRCSTSTQHLRWHYPTPPGMNSWFIHSFIIQRTLLGNPNDLFCFAGRRQVTNTKMIWVDRLGFDLHIYTQEGQVFETRIPFPREVTNEKAVKSSFNCMSHFAWEVEKTHVAADFDKVGFLKKIKWLIYLAAIVDWF